MNWEPHGQKSTSDIQLANWQWLWLWLSMGKGNITVPLSGVWPSCLEHELPTVTEH